MSLKKIIQSLNSHVIAHEEWEMLCMRFLFSWLVYDTLPDKIIYLTQPHPNGLAKFVDFTFLSVGNNYMLLQWVLLAALLCYTCNVVVLPSLIVMLFTSISWGTLNNSQGAINHNLQPITLIVLGQFLVMTYRILSEKKLQKIWIKLPLQDQQMVIHAAKAVLVSCYVVAAITKIERSNGTWIWTTPNLAVQILKTQADGYFNQLILEPGYREAIANWMTTFPNITRLIIGPSLFVELFAFVALIGRWWAFYVGLALVSLHALIEALLQLSFFEWQALVVIFLINVPFIVVAIARKMRGLFIRNGVQKQVSG